MSIFRNSIAISIAALAIGLGHQALAQEAPEADGAAASVPQGGDIVVTAQKRNERLQDVPMSLQVLNSNQMSSQGTYKLADYFAQLPGLAYIQSPMSSNIVLRGIATDSGIGIRPTSGVVIDDVPYGSSVNTGVIPDLDPSDLKQIEVLRGPQGTLYGASSMGGLLKYDMTDPDTNAVAGHFEVGGSNVDHGGEGYNVRGSVNVPITDTLAIHASGFQRRDPDFIHNLNSDDDNHSRVRGGRVSAIWKATDRLTLRASALIQDTRTGSSSVVDTDADLNPLYGQYTHDRIKGGDTFKGQVRMYTGKVNWDLGAVSLSSITGYAQHRAKAYQDVGYTTIGQYAGIFANIFGLDTSDPSALIDNRYNVDRFTQELRVASQGQHALDWQLGGFFSRERIHSTQDFYIADKQTGTVYADYPLLVSRGNNTFTEKAVYGDLTYHFAPRFDVQVGARYAGYKLGEDSYSGGILQDEAATTDTDKDHAVTYLISPRFRVNDDLMIYGRAASGYRAGGSNGTLIADIPRTYGSDTLWSYEVGVKSQMFDHALSIDASLFYIDWKDLQVSQTEPTYGSSYTTNAGKAYSKGLELSATWTPAPYWKVSASYAYIDARLSQDIPNYVEGSSAYGKDGDRLPYSARNSASASVKRDIPLPSGITGFVGADATYSGSREMEFTDYADVPRIHLPGYATFGLNGGLRTDRWSATLFIRNLTDKNGYINALRRGSAANSTIGATLIQPRTIGLTFGVNY
jgi:outer membrane receptor protein involved in Fe transport